MSEIIETRIGLLPSDWQIESLDEVTTKIQDGTHFSPQSNEGPCRYITSKNIRFGRMAVEDCGWISQKEHDAIYARCNVQRGDVLLTKDGANTGNAAINRLKEPFSLLSSVALIRADEHTADNGFLLQYLLSPRGQQRLKDLMAGNAITRLTLEKIKRFEVPQPVKSEQTKIARILTTLDNLIEKTEALIAKYQAIKQGMMHDLFTRGVDSSGQLRPTFQDAPDQYRESELGWIPKDCSVQKLKHVAERVVVGLALSVTHAYREKGVPLIRNQNIRSGYFEDDDMLYLDPQFAALFPNKAARKDDVLTVRTGANVGDTAIVPDKYVNCPTFTTLITSTDKTVLNPMYLVHYIVSKFGMFELNRLLVGGGKENLNVGEFVKLRVVVPPIASQEHFVAALATIESQLESERRALCKHKDMKSGLMQDLLTGKVRVKVDEAEEVAANA